MASIVMDEERPFRSPLFFFLSASKARELLGRLARAADFPGRVRRMPLVPTTDPAFRPEWSRGELEIVAEEGLPYPYALRDLDRRAMRLVVQPKADTRLHDALRELIQGAWDFSLPIPLLDETVRPTRNSVVVTFL